MRLLPSNGGILRRYCVLCMKQTVHLHVLFCKQYVSKTHSFWRRRFCSFFGHVKSLYTMFWLHLLTLQNYPGTKLWLMSYNTIMASLFMLLCNFHSNFLLNIATNKTACCCSSLDKIKVFIIMLSYAVQSS